MGKPGVGGTAFEIAADTKRVARYLMPRDGRLVKLSCYLDGQGSGAGSQVCRGVVYTSSGTLVAQGDEVVILDGQAPGWVDLSFSLSSEEPGSDLIGGALYDLGLLAGGASNSIRAYGDALVGATHRNTDTYADGAAGAFGGSTVLDFNLSVFGSFVNDWEAPFAEEMLYGRLPFEAAQATLETHSLVSQARTLARAGWYGTRRDPERGSFVIVDSLGPLGGMVGERLRIARTDLPTSRAIVAYCHTRDDLEFDLALSRRAFLALGSLTENSVNVEVAVVA